MKKYVMKFRWVIVIIIIVLLIIMGKSFLEMQNVNDTVSNEQTVRAKKIGKEEKHQVLELTGTIEAQDNIVITSKYGGKVKDVLVENGENVQNGQHVLLLEDTQQQNAMIEAQNALVKAQANLKYVQKTFERMKTLYEAEAISKSDYDSAELAYSVAVADVNLAQVAHSNALDAVKDTKVSSTLEGYIADCDITEGEMVEAGTPLMTVQNLDSIYLVVNINQDDITKIKLGQKVNVTSDSFSDKNFEGLIEIINPVANSTSRSFEVKTLVKNSDLLLKPGMFAKAQIEFDAPKMIIAVPQAAVSGKDGVYYVFIVKNNIAERRSVELGSTIGQEIEVISGLKEKEQLIISNVNKLKDGDSIRVVEE